MKIEEEIKSKFANPLVKAHVNILFTANQLNYQTTKTLKPFDLSLQQFNILRILRGQYPSPAPLKLLTSRMIDRMSNTSRLVDKLVVKDLVERTTCSANRRQVDIVITERGLQVLEEASTALENMQVGLTDLSDDDLTALSDLLDKFRG